MTPRGDEKTIEAPDPAPAAPAPRPAAVRAAVEIFSDPWSFAVLQEAFFAVRRFDELQRNLGISRGILAKRLRHLVKHEILERRQYQRRPDRYEYRLTDRGREMYPIFLELMRWGERWLETDGSPKLHLIHTTCGQRSRPHTVCNRCGECVRAEDMRYELD